ncbi:MAG: hypothetical protein J7K82_01870 [Thermoproteales archaeon]|nr:hypothetical protein [Thermoproteales archaeon]
MRYIILVVDNIGFFIDRTSVLSRCVSAAIFLSHNLRGDVIFRIFVRDGEYLITFKPTSLRNVRADEQSMGGILKKAYKAMARSIVKTKKIHHGVVLARKSFIAALKRPPETLLLYEASNGKDLRNIKLSGKYNNILYVLSNNLKYTSFEVEYFISHDFIPISVSVSPVSIDARIVLFNNEMDRRGI